MARKKENKRSDGYYEYKCIVERKYDGTPVYKSFYSKKSKADARAKAEEYKIELEKSRNKPDYILFEEWVEIFLEHYKDKVKASTYLYNYEIVFENHIIPFFKGKPLDAIIKTDVEKYIKMKSKTLAVSTVGLHISKLNTCFKEAIDNGYINYNPCKNIKKPSKASDKNVYTQEQADKVLEYCRLDKFGLPVHIILSYGMSKSEFLGIKYDDVDFENLTISINKGVTGKHRYSKEPVIAETKNKYRNRVIAISKETADYIKENVSYGFLATPNSDQTPVVSTFNDRYDTFMQRMHKYYEAKGIDIPVLHLHELRHTRASLWVNAGKNLFAIAEQMGWSDLSMLRKVYGHADIQKLRKELDL